VIIVMVDDRCPKSSKQSLLIVINVGSRAAFKMYRRLLKKNVNYYLFVNFSAEMNPIVRVCYAGTVSCKN
jgi:hypothetical protein